MPNLQNNRNLQNEEQLEESKLNQKVIVGADETGRGIIIGSMFIGACAITPSQEQSFRDWGVRDSKRYTSIGKLKAHAQLIKQHSLAWRTKKLSAETLNNFNKNNLTMDEAEAYTFFQILQEIVEEIKAVQEFRVDNFQEAKKLRQLMSKDPTTKNITLIISPKAESKYVSVSAAAILARVASLEELEKIRVKYGDFGSGSTSDKRTINWLRNYYKTHQSWPTEIVRTYWKTIDKIEREVR
ncbi:MAG: ribonuclease HII [Candidatus Heimdallarchaeota archaeon]|nr:ribonuclease HII [Candidatus Heimdallarchaeota archaeon]